MKFSSRLPAKEKRLVAIPGDLLTRLMEVANKQGKPFQTLLSQVVSGGLRALESGHSLEAVVDFYELIDMVRSSGAALIPVDLCSYMVTRLCETERENMTKTWREAGSWYGKYLSSRFPARDTPEMLGKLLSATRWDLREVMMTREGSKVKFRCIAPHLPEDSTYLLAAFVEGAMASSNNKVVSSEILKGMILQVFEQTLDSTAEMNLEKRHLSHAPKDLKIELSSTS